MPEGDTIFRAARTLHLALAGKVVTEFRSVLPHLTRIDEDAPIAGRTVDSVSASGKHLLIHLTGELVLRSHMRMNGSWHIYRPGEKWRRRGSDMRVVIGNSEWVAVGFSIPIAEFLASGALSRQRDLAALGPDPLTLAFDRREALARIAARGGEEIADVLLDQRAIAGLGNVYKSEILFACRVSPFAKVAALPGEVIERIVDEAVAQVRANVIDTRSGRPNTNPVMRRTTRRMNPAESLGVYGRAGSPCRICGTPVSRALQGRDARPTYWCAGCQAP